MIKCQLPHQCEPNIKMSLYYKTKIPQFKLLILADWKISATGIHRFIYL